MYAAIFKPLHALFFLADDPGEGDWEVERDVQLDLPMNLIQLAEWPEGTERPRQILCRSVSDPKHYKVFKHARDIDREQFEPTGLNWGGFYSRAAWQRFAEQLSSELARLPIADNDPDTARILDRGAEGAA